jgi:hypothetical protein
MNMNNDILAGNPNTLPTIGEHTRQFDSFNEAYLYANALIPIIHATHGNVFASKVWQDRFKRYRPKGRPERLIGMSVKAANDCNRLAPGCKFSLITESHNGGQSPNAFGGGFQFSVFCDSYLPYAYAMMHAENAYNAFGLDFSCVNSYFKTVMGYVYIGQSHSPNLNTNDADLYDRIYAESGSVRPPSLPFDEAYLPACTFVYALRPDLLAKAVRYNRNDYRAVHAETVLNRINVKPPKYRWPKVAKAA